MSRNTFNSVVFVCSQNICRSTVAEAVFTYLRDETKLPVAVSSAGIHAEPGRSPDPAIVAVAEQRGYKMNALRSRRLDANDFQPGTLIIAVDRATATAAEAMLEQMPQGGASDDLADDAASAPQVQMLMQFAQTFAAKYQRNKDLLFPADPRHMRDLLDRVEDACLGLLNTLMR